MHAWFTQHLRVLLNYNLFTESCKGTRCYEQTVPRWQGCMQRKL